MRATAEFPESTRLPNQPSRWYSVTRRAALQPDVVFSFVIVFPSVSPTSSSPPSFFFDFYYLSPYRKPLVFRVERSLHGDVRNSCNHEGDVFAARIQNDRCHVFALKIPSHDEIDNCEETYSKKWRSRRRIIMRNEAWSILVTLLSLLYLFDCSLFCIYRSILTFRNFVSRKIPRNHNRFTLLFTNVLQCSIYRLRARL